MGEVEAADIWWRALPPYRRVGLHNYIAGLNKHGPRPIENLPGQLAIEDLGQHDMSEETEEDS